MTMKAVTTTETFSEESADLTFSAICSLIVLAARLPMSLLKVVLDLLRQPLVLRAPRLVAQANAHNNAGHRHQFY